MDLHGVVVDVRAYGAEKHVATFNAFCKFDVHEVCCLVLHSCPTILLSYTHAAAKFMLVAYVQASKRDKRHIAFSFNANFCALAESRRRVFLYRSAPLSTFCAPVAAAKKSGGARAAALMALLQHTSPQHVLSLLEGDSVRGVQVLSESQLCILTTNRSYDLELLDIE